MVYFSIIIPIKKSAKKEFLVRCIHALNKQTFQEFEVIFVTSKQLEANLLNKIKDCKKAYVYFGEFSKTEARNIGAKQAKGKYLLNIDIDYVLPENVLDYSRKLIETYHAQAVILQETVVHKKTIWEKARYLERMITKDDLRLSAPQLIEKKLFNKIGGYDERIDGLDDWTLSLRLAKEHYKLRKIPPITEVFEPTNLIEIWINRFNKGRYLPLLKNYYKQIPQLSLNKQMILYIKSLNKIIQNPIVGLALFILKIFDTLPFYLGSLFPYQKTQIHNIYTTEAVAKKFDTENGQSNVSLYKDYQEKHMLKKIFQKNGKQDSILELGAGTGRITAFLKNLGYKILPTDTSKAMLQVLQKKRKMPKPELILDSSNLPYKTNNFTHVVSLRVIWHIMNKRQRDSFFSEAVRVSKNTICIDFTNRRKYQWLPIKLILKLFYPDFFDNSYYFTWQEIEQLTRKYNLKMCNVYYLEVLPPIPLQIIPRSFAYHIFPYYSNFEKVFSAFLQPGRFLVQFSKQQ